jgi:hypothetical protein
VLNIGVALGEYGPVGLGGPGGKNPGDAGTGGKAGPGGIGPNDGAAVGPAAGPGLNIGDEGEATGAEVGDDGAVGPKQILSETHIFIKALPIIPIWSHVSYPVSLLNFWTYIWYSPSGFIF